MNLQNIIPFVFILFNAFAQSNIDVIIIGFSDENRESIQKDKSEAIIDAKVSAIERAGLKIRSETSVLNYQLKRDLIESKAEAFLLPGYKIVDIGYGEDGIYRVVLVGEVSNKSIVTNVESLVNLKINVNADENSMPYNIILDGNVIRKLSGNGRVEIESLKSGKHNVKVQTDGYFIIDFNSLNPICHFT